MPRRARRTGSRPCCIDRPQWPVAADTVRAMSEDFTQRPRSARIYDALLGGSHNFAADREAARKLLAALPYAAEMCRINRAFLGRAVEHMVAAGVRQFLDIGSGIPTVGNVHEV